MRRLEAQRNELNAKGLQAVRMFMDTHFIFFSFIVRLLREELQLLQEQGSHVGEVVKAMDKKKVLVKVIKPHLLSDAGHGGGRENCCIKRRIQYLNNIIIVHVHYCPLKNMGINWSTFVCS